MQYAVCRAGQDRAGQGMAGLGKQPCMRESSGSHDGIQYSMFAVV